MKIEHAAMYVNDVEQARDFLINIWTENRITDIRLF